MAGKLPPRSVLVHGYATTPHCAALRRMRQKLDMSRFELPYVRLPSSNRAEKSLLHVASRPAASALAPLASLRMAPSRELRVRCSERALQARRMLSSALPEAQPNAVADGMPRYPDRTAAGALRALDYFGTGVFALSGALTAGTAGMDMLGCTTVGAITAMGGGTVRDLLLGNRPVFWMVETEYLALSIATALAAFWAWPSVSERFELVEDADVIRYADALGLGAFAVIGAQNGLRARVPALVCVVCGMMTATFGGVIRDVLCHKPARILHAKAEVYASTALSGAAIYVAAARAGLPLATRIVAGSSTTFLLRVLAWNYDLRLPLYNAKAALYNAVPALTPAADADDLKPKANE